jgi:hypothetical protein
MQDKSALATNLADPIMDSKADGDRPGEEYNDRGAYGGCQVRINAGDPMS